MIPTSATSPDQHIPFVSSLYLLNSMPTANATGSDMVDVDGIE